MSEKIRCIVCRKLFTPKGREQTCSPECRKKANSQNELAYLARKAAGLGIVRTCPVCGRSFAGKTSQVYCSKECKAVAYKAPKRIRTCRVCGKEYVAKHGEVTCGEKCAAVWRARYAAEYSRRARQDPEQVAHENALRRAREEKRREEEELRRRADPDRERRLRAAGVRVGYCPTCGKEYVTRSKTKIFCSVKCRDRWNTTPEALRRDMRKREVREQVQREAERRALEQDAQLRAAARKRAEEEARAEARRNRVKRTESGAVWYPVSCAEIQRIARETHRSYGEVCAEYLSMQVRRTYGRTGGGEE